MKAVRQIPADPQQLSLLALMEAQPNSSSIQGSPAQSEGASHPDNRPARQPSRLEATASLADVLRALEADASSERRHVEMKSAVRKMGEVLKRPLFEIPADPQQLRVLISNASRASIGMTKERWSRVRSLTLAALRDLGIDVLPGRDVGGLTTGWLGIAESLPTKSLRHGLSRFMSFCGRRRIEPADVTVETFKAFRTMLEAKSLCQTPDATFRSTVRRWNKAVSSGPGWPKLVVSLETHPRFYSLEWTAFPPSFVADVEAFLSNAGSRDELDDDYARAVRPSTVALRRRQLRQLASCLVAGGFPIARITGLDVIVQLANAKIALDENEVVTAARQHHRSATMPGSSALLRATGSKTCSLHLNSGKSPGGSM